MSVSVEREIKLVAPESFELPAMGGAVPGLVDGEPVRVELDATYYDTEDLSLARSGVTVRHRTGEPGPSWTVKLPESSTRTSLTRRELRFHGDADTVPARTADLVRAYARSRPLQPVARLHTRRTVVPLLDPSGLRVAELVDDRVAGVRADGQATVFREVELELTGSETGSRLQRAAVKRLARAGCRTEPPLPKLLRVLGEEAGRPADVAVTTLPADPTVLDAVRHALSLSVDRLLRHDAGVRLGEDPEAVHQLRVAARTLRSNLKTFRKVLDDDWVTSLRTELEWLGTAAGRLRDLDVLEQRLRGLAVHVDASDRPAIDTLLTRVARQRGHARRSTLAALRSDRYDELLDALVEAARSPRLRAGTAGDASARRFVRRAARAQVKRLDRAVAAESEPPSDTDMHKIRIQAKRTRYAIEAARPVVGGPAAKHAKAIAALQDVLGEFHDSVVMVHWLRDAAAARPSCGLAAGQLLAAERAEQGRLRDHLPDVWRDAAAAKRRTWL